MLFFIKMGVFFIKIYDVIILINHHSFIKFPYKTPCFCAILSFKFTHVWHRT